MALVTVVQPSVPLCRTAADLNEHAARSSLPPACSTSWIADDKRQPYDAVAGVTADGVVAYSNGNDEHWSNKAHYDNGLFMGYKWQCVEFARRWLWEARRLYLPRKDCAYCFADLPYVYEPVLGDTLQKHGSSVLDSSVDALSSSAEEESGASSYSLSADEVGSSSSNSSSDDDDDERNLLRMPSSLSHFGSHNVTWVKHACTYHRQGGSSAPVRGSLIIYPKAPGSPWGHIGVIVDVDLDASKVYVADQNRFFGLWGPHTYSAAFRLDVVAGKYYIRDPESECLGWLVC